MTGQPPLPTAAADRLYESERDSAAGLASLDDRRLLRALHWWRELPRAHDVALPGRDTLDPLSIPDLLPYVVLWTVTARGDGGFDYRCRLAGTAMVEMHGYEFTGQAMEAFHGSENARIQPEYDFVARSGQPHYAERSLSRMQRDYQRYRRILLPFAHRASSGHDGVALIMNVSHFIMG